MRDTIEWHHDDDGPEDPFQGPRHLSYCDGCGKAWITTYWVEELGQGFNWACSECSAKRKIR